MLPSDNRVPKSVRRESWRLHRLVPEMVQIRDIDDMRLGGFTPLSFGVDVGLRNTGICVIGFNGDAFGVYSITVGQKLSAKASNEVRVYRQYQIVKNVINTYKKFCGEDKPPAFMEDHAYSRTNTNRSTETIELHGQIKLQFYLQFGACIEPVGINSATSTVYCYGVAPKSKEHFKDLLLASGCHPWASNSSEHEIDAWGVAMRHLINEWEAETVNRINMLVESHKGNQLSLGD